VRRCSFCESLVPNHMLVSFLLYLSSTLKLTHLIALSCAGSTRFPNMCILRLSGCGLGASGVSILAAVLRFFPHLQEASLACNSICDHSIHSLAQAIVQCPALQILDLSAKIQTFSPGGQVLTHQSAVPAGQGVISHIGADLLATGLAQVCVNIYCASRMDLPSFSSCFSSKLY